MHVQSYEQICMTSLYIKLLFEYGILVKIHGTLWDIHDKKITDINSQKIITWTTAVYQFSNKQFFFLSPQISCTRWINMETNKVK